MFVLNGMYISYSFLFSNFRTYRPYSFFFFLFFFKFQTIVEKIAGQVPEKCTKLPHLRL